MSNSNGTAKMKITKQKRDDGPPLFNYQKARMKLLEELDPGGYYKSLYHKADDLSEKRRFNPESLRLDDLANEINVRVKITQREIFIIGELLWIAKARCKEEETSWMAWVEDNCDISYPTANNYMKVFRYCFSMVELALKVPISILYKVSEPKFPDELREYLFVNGGLDEISNGKLKELKAKYDKGGIEAVEPEIEEFNEANRIRKQISQTKDQFVNALRVLSHAKDNMEKGRDKFRKDFEKEIEGDDPEAQIIQQRLFDAVSEAYELMNEASQELLEPNGQSEW